MIVIVVPIMVATCSRAFQIAALALSLTAMFPVFAFCVMQLGFGFADLLFAFSVIIVIAVHRPCGNGSAQERQNYERGNECLGFLEHVSSSDRLDIVLSSMHMQPCHPSEKGRESIVPATQSISRYN
jgi:hypothetical protein